MSANDGSARNDGRVVRLADFSDRPALYRPDAVNVPSDAVTLARLLGDAADQLRDSCDGHRDMTELTDIVDRITHVAGALGTVYDHLAEWLYADGCPARHATDQFLKTADELRMAGASCRFAQSVVNEALDRGSTR
jgi:hypothetical protein